MRAIRRRAKTDASSLPEQLHLAFRAAPHSSEQFDSHPDLARAQLVKASAMSTKHTKTSLLSLPDELLEVVVSQVLYNRRSSACNLALACRRLSSLVQKEFFKEIGYGGRLKTFELLTTVLAGNAHLRALVKEMRFFRTIGLDEDGEDLNKEYRDYSTDYPGSPDVLAQYSSLRSLSILGASPDEIQLILGAPSCPILDNIRHLELRCGGDPNLGFTGVFKHKALWWNLLQRMPTLEELVLSSDILNEETESRIVFDEHDMPQPLPSVRYLKLESPVFLPEQIPLLEALLPNLEHLNLDCIFNEDVKHILDGAPVGLRRLTLCWANRDNRSHASLPLDRFARLDTLSLWDIAAPLLFPALRTTSIQSLHFDLATEVTDELLLGLVSGPTRMKHLASLRIDYIWTHGNEEALRRLAGLLATIQGDDLEDVRDRMRPSWPEGCSASGLQKTIEAARPNRIKVYGRAVDCLDWDHRFSDLAERCLVDHALAENDYTIIEPYLGEEGAGAAILRQRPRLAELVAKGRG
ncbi:hypothetical protein JCM10908_002386 [Rhodotorula pacifica]|uniref:uncharacterized protein n=1 Tax=Rhodotorula pacifica TaxID=1495444 RepID=UPI00317C5AD7